MRRASSLLPAPQARRAFVPAMSMAKTLDRVLSLFVRTRDAARMPCVFAFSVIYLDGDRSGKIYTKKYPEARQIRFSMGNFGLHFRHMACVESSPTCF